MKVSLDVDIGGTFTDLFLSYDGKTVFTKTPTTGYNLSVVFMQALKDAAALLEVLGWRSFEMLRLYSASQLRIC